jgi:tetratricopeptide (TPR) repeat protein
MGMNYHWLGRYTTIEDAKIAEAWASSLKPGEFEAAMYNDWPIGTWVVSSVHSSLRISTLDLSVPRVEEVFRNYLYSGLIACFGITSLLDDYQPDKLLLFNGRQSSTRVALELAKARNIRVVCHERGMLNESIQLFEDECCHALAPFYKLWDDWGDVPLSAKQLETTRTHLTDREYGKNLSWVAFSPPPQELDEVCSELQLDKNRPVWVLFTSSDDEIASDTQWHGPFEQQLDWIQSTVDFVRKNPDIQLVIRVHPNTKGQNAIGENKNQAIELEELGKTLPQNIIMVEPDDPISSYTLMDLCTVGLIYVSTVGIELTCKGKFVIVAARYYLADLPFVRTVGEVAQYDKLLEESAEVPLMEFFPQVQRLAYRYSYALFFRWNMPFPLVKMPTHFRGNLAYNTLDALEEGRDVSLDRICRIVLDNESIVLPPREEEKNRYAMEEDQWYESNEQFWAPSMAEHEKLEDAHFAYMGGNYPEATRQLFQALAINPNSSDTLNKIGVLYGLQGNKRNSLFYFRKALLMDYSNRKAKLNAARVLKIVGQDESARSLIQEHLQVFPTDQDAVQILDLSKDQDFTSVAWAM